MDTPDRDALLRRIRSLEAQLWILRHMLAVERGIRRRLERERVRKVRRELEGERRN